MISDRMGVGRWAYSAILLWKIFVPRGDLAEGLDQDRQARAGRGTENPASVNEVSVRRRLGQRLRAVAGLRRGARARPPAARQARCRSPAPASAASTASRIFSWGMGKESSCCSTSPAGCRSRPGVPLQTLDVDVACGAARTADHRGYAGGIALVLDIALHADHRRGVGLHAHADAGHEDAVQSARQQASVGRVARAAPARDDWP